MAKSEFSVSKEVADATKTYERNFRICLEQAGNKLRELEIYRASVIITFKYSLPDKATFIPKDLSEFVISRFGGTPVEVHIIEAAQRHLIITSIPAGSNPWEEHKKLIFLDGEDKAARNTIWIDTYPRHRGPYQGMFTYDDCLYTPIDILKNRTPGRGEPKPVDAKVILAVAQMLPDPTYRRRFFGLFGPLALTHAVNKHLWQPERKVEVSL